MKNLIARFVQDESGATAIEYGLIAAGISLAIIAVVNGLGTNLNAKFTSINNSLGGEFATWARALWLFSAPLPPAAAALAILRYRLWDVDLVISRTVVFGLLWVATSAAFLGVALAGGLLVAGPDSRVLSALVLALLALACRVASIW